MAAIAASIRRFSEIRLGTAPDPPQVHDPHLHLHPAGGGELQAVGDQVVQHLAQPRRRQAAGGRSLLAHHGGQRLRLAFD